MGGGGGSKYVPVPTYEEPLPVAQPRKAVTAEPVLQLMSEAEEKNKKFAAAALTQDWLKPPRLGTPGIERKDVLGL